MEGVTTFVKVETSLDQHSNHFNLNNDEIKKAIEPVEAATKTATEDIETIYKIYNKCWESWNWDSYK